MLLLPFSRPRGQSSQLPLLMILSGLLLLVVVEAAFAVGAVKTYDMLGKKLREAPQRGVSRKSPSPNSQNVVIDPVTQQQEEVEKKVAIIADGSSAFPFSKSLSTLGVIVTALLLLCLSLVAVACVLQLCKVCRDQVSGGWTDQQAEHPQPAARPMKAVFLRPHPVPPPTPKTGASNGSQLPAPRPTGPQGPPPGLPGPRAPAVAASGPSAANQVAPSVDSRSLNDEATSTTSSSSYSSDSDGERKRQILARY